MTYLSQHEIGSNAAMNSRVAQCAAQQGQLDPDAWTATNRRFWSAAPGWEDAWASAKASHVNLSGYDPGADEACITDQMILSQVQAMVMPQTTGESPGAAPKA